MAWLEWQSEQDGANALPAAKARPWTLSRKASTGWAKGIWYLARKSGFEWQEAQVFGKFCFATGESGSLAARISCADPWQDSHDGLPDSPLGTAMPCTLARKFLTS